MCIATALDAKTVYLLPLSLIRSPSGGSSLLAHCVNLPDNHSLQIRSQQSQQIRTQYRGKYSACVSYPPKKTNVYIGTSKVQRQARIARDIGKVPSLKIGLSIFFETTRWQELMMALLKIVPDWTMKLFLAKLCLLIDHRANVIISDLPSIMLWLLQ